MSFAEYHDDDLVAYRSQLTSKKTRISDKAKGGHRDKGDKNKGSENRGSQTHRHIIFLFLFIFIFPSFNPFASLSFSSRTRPSDLHRIFYPYPFSFLAISRAF